MSRRQMTPAVRALLTLVLTDATRAYLFDNDPKALAQAVGALLYGTETPGLDPDAARVLQLTQDLLEQRGVHIRSATTVEEP